ncbi:transposase InsO family protein [Mycobacterium sp. URHB0021]|jgi:transposase InsO family protein
MSRPPSSKHHRKIAALMRADGHRVTNSSVARALRRRGLLLPQGFRADRKSWAALRRRVFRDPPTERNRVWQTDFSEFETTNCGIWRICAVIDYATRYCLAIIVTSTGRGADALERDAPVVEFFAVRGTVAGEAPVRSLRVYGPPRERSAVRLGCPAEGRSGRPACDDGEAGPDPRLREYVQDRQTGQISGCVQQSGLVAEPECEGRRVVAG